MRKAMTLWVLRVVRLLPACVILWVACYFLLPPTTDGVSVTVVHYATSQDYTAYHREGTTIFQRTLTDGPTVSAVHDALNRLHYFSVLENHSSCYPGFETPTYVYTFDLLWHGIAVKSYMLASYTCEWDVRTLGLWLPQSVVDSSTVWPDLLRLTGMPDQPNPLS